MVDDMGTKRLCIIFFVFFLQGVLKGKRWFTSRGQTLWDPKTRNVTTCVEMPCGKRATRGTDVNGAREVFLVAECSEPLTEARDHSVRGKERVQIFRAPHASAIQILPVRAGRMQR